MILICYDIEHNTLRAALSRCLLQAGLLRINKSVFMGEITDTSLVQLRSTLCALMARAAVQDSLVLLPLTTRQAQRMEVLGNDALIDIDLMTGDQHTLII